MKIFGILLAAGHSTRMGAHGSKMWLELGGRPVLAWALDHFAPSMTHGVVVARDTEQIQVRSLLKQSGYAHWTVVTGGDERFHSVVRGLQALDAIADREDVVLIHDAARLFVPSSVIHRVIRALAEYDAVIPAVPVVDTVKEKGEETGIVGMTLRRDRLLLAQTPQGFRFGVVKSAYDRWSGGIPTDDAEVVAASGTRVAYVSGDPVNRKLTTPEDMAWFSWVLQQQGGRP